MLKKSFVVANSIRIVQWFREYMPQISYNYLKASLRRKDINVNGIKVTTDYHLRIGDNINVWNKICERNNQNIKVDAHKFITKKQYAKIVDHTLEYVVIDKKAGVSSQNGTKVTISLAEIIKAQLGKKPYIVHRLDKEVSGLMVIALDVHTARELSSSLQNHAWKKKYIAVLEMTPAQYRDFKLGLNKHPKSIIDKSTIRDDIDGKTAVTNYKFLGYIPRTISWPFRKEDIKEKNLYSDSRCVFELEPITGRKHQLRIHCAKYLAPIVGDNKYGMKAKQMMLRCHYLNFKIDNNCFEYSL